VCMMTEENPFVDIEVVAGMGYVRCVHHSLLSLLESTLQLVEHLCSFL